MACSSSHDGVCGLGDENEQRAQKALFRQDGETGGEKMAGEGTRNRERSGKEEKKKINKKRGRLNGVQEVIAAVAVVEPAVNERAANQQAGYDESRATTAKYAPGPGA